MEPRFNPGDIVRVYAEWDNTEYYFLIEGECRVDIDSEYEYPYRCLNNDRRGWGNFGHPDTRKVA